MKKILIGHKNGHDYTDYQTSPAVYQGYFRYRREQFPLEVEGLDDFTDYWRILAERDTERFAADYQRYYWEDQGEHDRASYFTDSDTHKLNLNVFCEAGESLTAFEQMLTRIRLNHVTIWDYWLDGQDPAVKNWRDAEHSLAANWSLDFASQQAEENVYFLYWGIDRLNWPTAYQPDVYDPKDLPRQNVIFMLLSAWGYNYRRNSPAKFAVFMTKQKAQFSQNLGDYFKHVADGYLG